MTKVVLHGEGLDEFLNFPCRTLAVRLTKKAPQLMYWVVQ